MKFVALIKVIANTDSRIKYRKYIEKRGGPDAAWHLPDGVKILESGVTFGGPYDIVIFYEASDEETAYQAFRKVWPYCHIERYLTKQCDWCENTKDMI
jgi:hypothetical protein